MYQLTKIFALFSVCSVGYSQGVYIDLGSSGRGGLPYVQVAISDGETRLGPTFDHFVLDTGGPGIYLLGSNADDAHASYDGFRVGSLESPGPSGRSVEYFVSDPLSITIDDGFTLDGIAMMSDPTFPSSLFVPGVVGMPAMVNRVTSLNYHRDLAGLSPLERLFGSVEVGFSDMLPQSIGHRYGVRVSASLSLRPDELDALDVVPTISPFPLLVATHRRGCETTTNTLLFDTGATVSSLSMDRLAEMDISIDDAVSFITVTLADGEVVVPQFRLDEIRVPTVQGTDLVWRRRDESGFLVIGSDFFDDVPFDGILGADIFGVSTVEAHHLDFRGLQSADDQGSGVIHFDVVGEIDQPTKAEIIRPADANADGAVDQLDRDIWQTHDGQSGTRCSTGDFNRDGKTDAADLEIWTAQQTREVACDLNGDLECSVNDLDMLLGALGSEKTLFDLDASGGIIDLADREAWLSVAGKTTHEAAFLLGDLNFDTEVNAIDLNFLGRNWNSSGDFGYSNGDTNGDGIVDATDLNAIGANWGANSVSSLAVPEPSGDCLLVGLAFVLAVNRRIIRLADKPS